MTVRDAVIGDAAGIAAVHVESWRFAYRGLVPDELLDSLSVPRRTAEWRDRLKQGVEVHVAVRDTAIIGFCALRRDPGEPVEIGALYLSPVAIGTGVGTRLMTQALTRLRTAGEAVVTLWVLAGNERARAFYARHGFAPTGRSGEWHGAPELQLALALASCSA